MKSDGNDGFVTGMHLIAGMHLFHFFFSFLFFPVLSIRTNAELLKKKKKISPQTNAVLSSKIIMTALGHMNLSS